MALDACNSAIAAAIGRELTDREKGAVSRRALELKRKIDLAGNDPLAIESVLGEFGKDIATQRAIQRRQAAINFRVGREKDAYRQSVDFAKAVPAEVAKGLFVQSQKNYFGAKASLGTAVGREVYARTSAFNADLMKAGLHDYAFKGNDDRNIWLARQALNDPKADPAALVKQYGKDAVGVAQIIEKHQEAGRMEQNLAGAWINRNPDYVTQQTSHPYRLARAGENRFGSDESFQAWAKDMGNLDWDKAFSGDLANADDARRMGRLRSVWNQFVASKHLSWEDHGSFGTGQANIARAASKDRELVFKSPEDSYNYWSKYGMPGSLAESAWHDLSSAGRNIAIMREWGPNAKANIGKFFDRWMKELNTNGDTEGMRKLALAQRKVTDQYLPTLTDSIGHPDSNFVSHYLSIARQTLLTAKIGASLPSMIGDLVLKASYAQRFGSRSTGNFLGELARSTGAMFHEVSGADKQTLAKEFGIRLQNSLTPLGMEYHELAGTGKIAKFNQLVMKASGHSWGSNAIRTDTLNAEGFRTWTMRDKAFDQLPVGRRDLFSQFGIDDKMWDIIRRSEPLELERGTQVFSPSKIRDMDAGEFKSVAAGESDAQLKRARDLVADRYRNMMGELADTATSEPNRNMRTILNGPIASAQPWQQELYRGFFVLKGFLANYMRNHLGGVMMGQDADPNNVGFAKALWRLMTFRGQGSSYKMMGSLVAGGIGMGYIRNALGDLASGKTPLDPTDFNSPDGNILNSAGATAMKRAMLFQSFGLATDFILGSGSKPDADVWEKIGGLSGPELETAGDIVDFATRAAVHLGERGSKKGYTNDDFLRDFGKDSSGLANTAYHSVPGNNLLWTKWATDYFILDNMMEMMNPGYKDRLQQRMSNQGQTFLLSGGK